MNTLPPAPDPAKLTIIEMGSTLNIKQCISNNLYIIEYTNNTNSNWKFLGKLVSLELKKIASGDGTYSFWAYQYENDVINVGDDTTTYNIYNATESDPTSYLKKQETSTNTDTQTTWFAVWSVKKKQVTDESEKIDIITDQILTIKQKPGTTYSPEYIITTKNNGVYHVDINNKIIGGKRTRTRRPKKSARPRKQHNKKTRKHSRK
jgi:hypothetical protein